MALTRKQQRFVDEYLLDLNATQAAIRCGYSPKTAEVQGCRLLSNAKIAPAVEKALQARAERTKIDADWLLLRLAEEATADVNDLYDENGHLRPVADWPLIWRQGLVAGIETVREKVGKDKNGDPEYSTVHKVKLSDRVRRLELLGKHVDIQAFRERVDMHIIDPYAELEEARMAKKAARESRAVH